MTHRRTFNWFEQHRLLDEHINVLEDQADTPAATSGAAILGLLGHALISCAESLEHPLVAVSSDLADATLCPQCGRRQAQFGDCLAGDECPMLQR
jgi:hypothetical protein